MKVLREKEYHMLFSKMHLSPLFLERHLIETDRMRPQGIYKGNINLNPDHYAGQSKEVKYETSSFIWEVQIIKKGHHDVPVFDTCLQHVYFGICGEPYRPGRE